MDVTEFDKLRNIRELLEEKDYQKVAEASENVDLKKISSLTLMMSMSEACEHVQHYQKARELLQEIHSRNSIPRKMIMYKLILNHIRLEESGEANELYSQFTQLWPESMENYALGYELEEMAEGILEKKIELLEQCREKQLTEKWGYHLAELYEQAGRLEECGELCHELIMFFGYGNRGEYVEKAIQLKEKHGKLTPEEERICGREQKDLTEAEKTLDQEKDLQEQESISEDKEQTDKEDLEVAEQEEEKISDKDETIEKTGSAEETEEKGDETLVQETEKEFQQEEIRIEIAEEEKETLRQEQRDYVERWKKSQKPLKPMKPGKPLLSESITSEKSRPRSIFNVINEKIDSFLENSENEYEGIGDLDQEDKNLSDSAEKHRFLSRTEKKHDESALLEQLKKKLMAAQEEVKKIYHEPTEPEEQSVVPEEEFSQTTEEDSEIEVVPEYEDWEEEQQEELPEEQEEGEAEAEKKFDSLSLEEFEEVVKVFAGTRNAVIDESGLTSVRTIAEKYQLEETPLTDTLAEEIVDLAVAKAKEAGSVFMEVSENKKENKRNKKDKEEDKEEKIVLQGEHFEM